MLCSHSVRVHTYKPSFTEDISSAHGKFSRNQIYVVTRRIMMAVTLATMPKDKRQSVIRFLTLEIASVVRF